MKPWQYHNPVAVHFGAGVIESLPQALAGRRADAASPSPKPRRSACCRACASCSAPSLAGVIDQTQPNPDVDGLDVLYREFWRSAGVRAR